MKSFLQNVLIAFVLIVLAFFLQRRYIKEFPSFIHAWAQSDHYALAQGFTNNGFNFFKPETFVYNHQFPYGWAVPSDQSITAVDFPLNNFIPAIAMKVLGKKSPWIYRCYILAYSLIGLFFLFKLSILAGNTFARSFLITVVAATSPLFVYYQAGFLPTIPSLSNAIIGIYFYYRYLNTNRNKHFYFAIALLTLSALCRTTFAILLIAVFCFEAISYLKHKTIERTKIYSLAFSTLSIAGYFLYNSLLRKKYGSIFLSNFLPPDNVDEVKTTLQTIKNNWAFTYFSEVQLIIFAAIIICSLFFIFFREKKLSTVNTQFLFIAALIFTGCTLFFFLLMKQFPEHDYYFLDTFFLPVLMLILLLLTAIPDSNRTLMKITSLLTVLVLCVPMVLQASASQKKRRLTGTWDKTNQTILNYNNSAQFLDSAGVSQSAKILAIDVAAPNIPFLLMQRKGYALLSTEKELLEKAVAWDFDYAVIQNQYFLSDIYSSYPDLINKISRIADNGKISLCKRRNPNEKFIHEVSFENDNENFWQNLVASSEDAYSGKRCGYLAPTSEFGITFKASLPELKNRACFLFFSGMFKSKILNDCELVVVVNENGKNIFYHSRNLKKFLKRNNEWEKLEFVFELPRVAADNYELGVYLWNTGKSELLVDDFGLKIF